jgi:hypothetical protein
MYVPHAVTISKSAFCIYGFRMIPSETEIISSNSVNQLIFVMVKCCVFFAVRTEFLNIFLDQLRFWRVNDVFWYTVIRDTNADVEGQCKQYSRWHRHSYGRGNENTVKIRLVSSLHSDAILQCCGGVDWFQLAQDLSDSGGSMFESRPDNGYAEGIRSFP